MRIQSRPGSSSEEVFMGNRCYGVKPMYELKTLGTADSSASEISLKQRIMSPPQLPPTVQTKSPFNIICERTSATKLAIKKWRHNFKLFQSFWTVALRHSVCDFCQQILSFSTFRRGNLILILNSGNMVYESIYQSWIRLSHFSLRSCFCSFSIWYDS